MKENRIDYIDIAKGLGMLAIIWGHIMETGFTNVFVYSFHIPLFFFISGVVFRKDKYSTFGAFIKRRLNTLIIPYLLFSFLTWLLWVLYSKLTHSNVDSYIMPLLQTFVAQGSWGYLVHNVPLWFVSCLLAIEILYYFICKVKKDIVVIAICGALAVVSFLMEKFSSVFDFKVLPWSIGAACAGIIFYALGNIASKHNIIEALRSSCRVKPILWGGGTNNMYTSFGLSFRNKRSCLNGA